MKINMKALKAKWITLHKTKIEDVDKNIDKGVCMESFCVGWCMAQGLSLKESLSFYSEQLSEGKYF